jgi:hypothetical protein
VIPCPSAIVTLSTEYWNFVASTYGNITASIIGAFTFFKDAIIEYKQSSGTIELQNEILDKLHTSNTELLKHLEEERSSSSKIRTDLISDIRIHEETNRKLATQNTELLESGKHFKAASNVEKGLQVVSLLGNFAFIGIQFLNAYTSFQNLSSVSTNEVKLLISSVNALIQGLNTQRVRETAARRAAESTSTSAPSTGLTCENINFTSEFE